MAFNDLFSGLMPAALSGQRAALQPMQQLRAMAYINRDARMGEPRPGRMGMGHPMPYGLPPDTPDYSSFTYDPAARAMAQQALAPFGQHPLAPSQVNPNALLPNSGFFGNHPGLTRGLEGAIFGAANTQGADTLGEGISNVARGLIGGQTERNALINRQFERPFQSAMMLQNLKSMAMGDDLHDAMIQHYRAESQHLQAMDKLGIEKEQLATEKAGVYAPRPDATGSWVYDPDNKESVNGWRHVHEGGKIGERIPPTMLPYFKAMGVDPETATPEQWQKAMAAHQHDQERLAYNTTLNRDQAHFDSGARDDDATKYSKGEDAFIKKQAGNPAFWAMQGINPKDTAAQKRWYESNFEPPDGYSSRPGQSSDPVGDFLRGGTKPQQPSPMPQKQAAAKKPAPAKKPKPAHPNNLGSLQLTPYVDLNSPIPQQ